MKQQKTLISFPLVTMIYCMILIARMRSLMSLKARAVSLAHDLGKQTWMALALVRQNLDIPFLVVTVSA